MSQKKLVLHFDINGTITPVDTTEPGSKEENANMVIAKSVYGTVNNNNWTLNQEYDKESTDSITYYDYLKTIDNQYKKKSFTFTHPGEPGESLAHLVPLLVNSMDIFLFQSFLNVLHEFPDALIVFRTFGLDADEVIEFLRTNEKTSHKFKNIIKGDFSYDHEERPLITLENGHQISEMHKFNKFILNTDTHLALKESYDHWNRNHRSKKCGKQLLGHEDMLQIFFDDNDCVNVINGYNSHFVKINTLAALQNNSYYVDHIRNII